jgi:hypothetical protein
MMTNKIDEMRAFYGLEDAESIFGFLGDFDDEEEIREYCWKVLRAFPDLNKEAWILGMEGGDYIYSFDGNYVFITDDIWNFNLIATDPVLKLLCKKIMDLKASGSNKNMNPETGVLQSQETMILVKVWHIKNIMCDLVFIDF